VIEWGYDHDPTLPMENSIYHNEDCATNAKCFKVLNGKRTSGESSLGDSTIWETLAF